MKSRQAIYSATSPSSLQLVRPTPLPPYREKHGHTVQSLTGAGTVEAAEYTTAPYKYTRTRAPPLINSFRIPQHRQSQKITRIATRSAPWTRANAVDDGRD